MTAKPSRRRRWLAWSTIVVAVLVTVSCAAGHDERRLASVEPQLSGALAARDGEPTITIVSPNSGDSVPSVFTLEVDVSNVSLAPKGRTRDGEAHFHVLIDDDCLAPGVVIAEDDAVHVGSGATEVELELEPGPHDVCVQLGDGFHVALDVTDTASLTVVGEPD